MLEDYQIKANELFLAGEVYSFSYNICEMFTAGYGKLDMYGDFEYPLYVNQGTMEAQPWEEE